MKFDEEIGYWVDDLGTKFIKNEYDPTIPSYIEITAHQWLGRQHRSKYVLYWPESLDESVRANLEFILKEKMRRQASSSLTKIGRILRKIDEAGQRTGSPLTVEDLLDVETIWRIWDIINSNDRPWLRSLIRDLSDAVDPGSTHTIALIMDGWRAGRALNWGKAVVEWNPEEGSLSSSELELLRRYLEPVVGEPPEDHFARICVRIGLYTLRRSSQITGIKADGLRRIDTTVGTTCDLKIPLAKAQTGRAECWEPIPKGLADDIEAYRARPYIRNSRAGKEFLLPAFRPGMTAVPAASSHVRCTVDAWIKKLGLISPRTNRTMRVSMRRLRHTGATHMAMQGYGRDLIADCLQQENSASASYYIDAVGADYLPVFETADRRLGGKFSSMSDAWFSGKIVNRSEAPNRPIMVPHLTKPAVVGACGKDGECPIHPLFSCYSCNHYLAFRDANHEKVLDFVEEEYQRWREAEISAWRSKAMKDFDRIAAGVREVIAAIEEDKKNATK